MNHLLFFLFILCLLKFVVDTQGNLNWMQSRETTIKSPVWRGRESEISPYGNPKGSDSANLDSAAEV